MSGKDKQTPSLMLKSASRDLMPIIAVCISAIVLTLVAVTVYKMMSNSSKEAVELQPTLLEKRYLDLLARGERYLQEGNLKAAEKEYTGARDLAVKENGSAILLAELELRLAYIMLKRNRPERAEKHMLKAATLLKETGTELDEQLRELQNKIAQEKAAAAQKTDTAKDPMP